MMHHVVAVSLDYGLENKRYGWRKSACGQTSIRITDATFLQLKETLQVLCK